jgi:hypothetical protein
MLLCNKQGQGHSKKEKKKSTLLISTSLDFAYERKSKFDNLVIFQNALVGKSGEAIALQCRKLSSGICDSL